MDRELSKRLNLLIAAPKFFYRIRQDGSAEVLSSPMVPADDALYWVGAKIRLHNGDEIDGVIALRDGGATHETIFFRVNGDWFTSDDEGLPDSLNLDRGDIFPINWTYSVPVPNDTFHP